MLFLILCHYFLTLSGFAVEYIIFSYFLVLNANEYSYLYTVIYIFMVLWYKRFELPSIWKFIFAMSPSAFILLIYK